MKVMFLKQTIFISSLLTCQTSSNEIIQYTNSKQKLAVGAKRG